jgi:hypothetical protein
MSRFEQLLERMGTDMQHTRQEIQETRTAQTNSFREMQHIVSGLTNQVAAVSMSVESIQARVAVIEATVDEVAELRETVKSFSIESVKASLKEDLMAELSAQCKTLIADSTKNLPAAPPFPPPGPPGWGGSHDDHGAHPATFVAKKVFLKGFCDWGRDDEALRRDDAERIYREVLGMLSPAHQAWIDQSRPGAPFRRNRQIVFHLRDTAPHDAAHHIVRDGNVVLKEAGNETTVNGKQVWLQADAPDHVKQRRACLAKARSAAAQALGTSWSFAPDWPAGILYIERGGTEQIIGKHDRKKGWQWQNAVIDQVYGAGKAAAVAAAMLDA